MRIHLNKKHIILISVVTIAVLVSIVLMAIFLPYPVQKGSLNAKLNITQYATDTPGDKIHFLNTGSSDAILLESDGHFALIDCAEDSDNPRDFPGLVFKGYEDLVVNYVKQIAKDDNGEVYLDFVLGTHAHSDHIGGFDTLINNEAFTIGKAYLKTYDSSRIDSHEVEKWDNQEVYDQMVNALNAKNVPIVNEIDTTPFSLGNMTITIHNGLLEKELTNIGENDNSMAILVETNGYKTLLAGDMDNLSGDEIRVAKTIGEIDVFKLGHHGYDNSNSKEMLSYLKPKISVITNNVAGINYSTGKNIVVKHNSALIDTWSYNGIVVAFDNGIKVYDQIHKL